MKTFIANEVLIWLFTGITLMIFYWITDYHDFYLSGLICLVMSRIAKIDQNKEK